MFLGGVLHIFGKLLMRVIIRFKLCLNQRSAQEVMGVQSGKSPNFGNFETPNLGIVGKITFGCNPLGQT